MASPAIFAAAGFVLGRIRHAMRGSGPSRIVINGGQGFVRRFGAESASRDGRQIAALPPPEGTAVVLGHDADPPPSCDMARIVGEGAAIRHTETGSRRSARRP